MDKESKKTDEWFDTLHDLGEQLAANTELKKLLDENKCNLKDRPSLADHINTLYENQKKLWNALNMVVEHVVRIHDRQNELAAKIWRLEK